MSCTSNTHRALLLHICRCPYYRTAEDALYGTLTITDDDGGYADTYWDSLTTTTLTTSQCGIDLAGFPDKYKSAFLADPDSPTCGQWLQFTSQYPGSGPCYPVLVPTVDHLNRWAPQKPPIERLALLCLCRLWTISTDWLPQSQHCSSIHVLEENVTSLSCHCHVNNSAMKPHNL